MVKWVTLDSRTLLKPYTSNIYEMEEDEPNEVNKIQKNTNYSAYDTPRVIYGPASYSD